MATARGRPRARGGPGGGTAAAEGLYGTHPLRARGRRRGSMSLPQDWRMLSGEARDAWHEYRRAQSSAAPKRAAADAAFDEVKAKKRRWVEADKAACEGEEEAIERRWAFDALAKRDRDASADAQAKVWSERLKSHDDSDMNAFVCFGCREPALLSVNQDGDPVLHDSAGLHECRFGKCPSGMLWCKDCLEKHESIQGAYDEGHTAKPLFEECAGPYVVGFDCGCIGGCGSSVPITYYLDRAGTQAWGGGAPRHDAKVLVESGLAGHVKLSKTTRREANKSLEAAAERLKAAPAAPIYVADSDGN